VAETEFKLDPEIQAKVDEAEQEVLTFSYARPGGDLGNSKAMVRLGRGGAVRGVVQVVKKNGGENNLHYHTSADTLWMVIKGRVRFYGAGDKVLGEFGPMEGMITPRYFRYWFENCSDEDLELLQVGAFADVALKSTGRTDCEPQRYELGTAPHFSVESKL
jgi:oxalate decarboxylase/phosphoglucose isomerase-like protein (cupin superfamily)